MSGSIVCYGKGYVWFGQVLPKKVRTSNWSVWPRLWGSNRPFKRQKGMVGVNTQAGSGKRKVRSVLAMPKVGRGRFRDNTLILRHF